MFKPFKVVSMVTLISYKHTIARFVSHMFILLRMSGGVERRRAVRPQAQLEWGWNASRVEKLNIIGKN